MKDPLLSINTVEENQQNHPLSLRQLLQKQIFKVIHYWFIRYNPLYFFSAFCVLLGIFLISNNLVVEVEAKNWSDAHIFLVMVAQLYELFVIASIAFLVKLTNIVRLYF